MLCISIWSQALNSISCGDVHALALMTDGSVLSWGTGTFGRLGHGNGPSGKELGRGDRAEPSLVERLRDLKMQQVCLLSAFVVAVHIFGDACDQRFVWLTCIH